MMQCNVILSSNNMNYDFFLKFLLKYKCLRFLILIFYSLFCMFSGRGSIAKMKAEKPANVLNNYLRIPQNPIYTEKH